AGETTRPRLPSGGRGRETMRDRETTPSRAEDLREVGREQAARTPVQAGRVAALEILVDDPAPKLALQLHPLVEMLDPATHQYRHRLDQFGHTESLQQNHLGVVELVVDLARQFGPRF